jgi:uncharacterized membrane protein YkoI
MDIKMKTTKKLVMAVAVIATMTATGSHVFASQLQSPGSITTNQITKAQQISIVKISKEQAQNIALSQVNGSTLKEMELKNKHGRAIYEVKIIKDTTEHEFKIDANSGNIISSKIDNYEDNSKDELKDEISINAVKTKVSLNQAKEIALAKVTGGTINKVELKNRSNGYVFEIEVVNGTTEHKFKIDANSGNIISSHVDIQDEIDND